MVTKRFFCLVIRSTCIGFILFVINESSFSRSNRIARFVCFFIVFCSGFCSLFWQFVATPNVHGIWRNVSKSIFFSLIACSIADEQGVERTIWASRWSVKDLKRKTNLGYLSPLTVPFWSDTKTELKNDLYKHAHTHTTKVMHVTSVGWPIRLGR
jgi:hypothetical protein